MLRATTRDRRDYVRQAARRTALRRADAPARHQRGAERRRPNTGSTPRRWPRSSRSSSGSASTRPSPRDVAETEELVDGGDPDMRELAQRGAEVAGRAPRRAARRAEDPADPEGSERREERHARNPRRHRRRRGGAVRRRAVPDVQQVRRAPGLAARGDVEQRHRRRRPEGSHRDDRGARRLQQAEVRERRAPRAARAGDRGQRPHPHLDGHRRGAAGGRGSRRPDQRQGSAHRHVLLERPRRPERQHDLLRRPHHPPPDRRRRLAAGREVADQEPREGDEGAALAPLRDGDAEAAGRDRQGPPQPGRHRRALGEDPHLQLHARTGSPTTAINFTTHRLAEVLNGDLAELLDDVITHYQSEKLKDATAVS